MAVKNYKLKKGQWTDQVLNPGIDKTVPLGMVTVVYNPDGSEAGFIKNGYFYKPGEKVKAQPKSKLQASKTSASSVDPLAKYDLPPAVDISEIKNMTPDEIKNHIAEAKKRSAAATKLYQNTSSSDTDYAYIKQANDSAINQLNVLQDAVSSKTTKSEKISSASTSVAKDTENNSLSQYTNQAKNLKGNTPLGQIAKEFNNPNNQLKNAKNRVKTLQEIIDSADTNSKEFKDAKAELAKLNSSLPDLQTKADTDKSNVDATQAQKDADAAKKKLADIQARADAGSENAKKQLADAKVAADAAQVKAEATKAKADAAKGATTNSTTSTGDEVISGNQLNASQTASFKAAVARDIAPTGKSSNAATGGNGTTGGTSGHGTSSGNPVVGSIWDGKKWVAPKTPPATNQTTDVNAFLTKYGTTLAFIQSDPSLQKLFNDAQKQNIQDPKAFTALLAQTDWAKRLSSSAQSEEINRLTTPSTYADSYNRMREHIAQLAVSMGEAITPNDIGPEIKATGPNGTYTADDVKRTEGTITQWALDHKSDISFTDAELSTFIAKKGAINLALPGGQAARDNMDLKAYANQMGLGSLALPPSSDPSKMGSDYFSSAAQSILLGKSTVDTWKADMLSQAKDTYKAFAPALDAGQTVKNIAAPYINTMANLLEIPTDQLDLSATTGYGKMVHDALIGNDPANQKPMALYDFEKLIKTRPEWGKTNNARDTVMGGVHDLLKAFGKVN